MSPASSGRIASLPISFDPNGPRIGKVRLLRKTSAGFRPRTNEEIGRLCLESFGCDAETHGLEERLDSIASALNVGDLPLAAILAGRLSIAFDVDRATTAFMEKAKVDDPKHPGYPAGTADHKGGQFRPLDASSGPAETGTGRSRRLTKRRAARMSLKKLLPVRRALRLLAENAAALIAEPIPFVDAVMNAVALADDLAAFKELADGLADSKSAMEFAENAPFELEDLRVSRESQGFGGFGAFKKIDVEKQFGPAGDGFDYHHLVEQGPNDGIIPETEIHSTDNIVRVPRLFHEEVNSFYATPQLFAEGLMAPRSFLRGKSFDDQKDYAVSVLRHLGAVK